MDPPGGFEPWIPRYVTQWQCHYFIIKRNNLKKIALEWTWTEQKNIFHKIKWWRNIWYQYIFIYLSIYLSIEYYILHVYAWNIHTQTYICAYICIYVIHIYIYIYIYIYIQYIYIQSIIYLMTDDCNTWNLKIYSNIGYYDIISIYVYW